MHIFIWLCDVTRLVLASACPWHQAVGESPDVLGRYPHQSGVRTFSLWVLGLLPKKIGSSGGSGMISPAACSSAISRV
jgi:hypothetical protein